MDVPAPPGSLKDYGFSLATTDPPGTEQEEMERLQEELKTWKEKVEAAEKIKAELLVSKSKAEEECAKAEEELIELKNNSMYKDSLQGELRVLYQEKSELKKEIEKLKEELEKYTLQAQNSKTKKKVAEVKMKFSHLEEVRKDCSDLDTHCVFSAAAKIPFRLSQKQALLTFEDEEVAQRLAKMQKHSVKLEETVDVKVMPFTLEMGIKFELHVTISGKKIHVSEIPELPIPEDWMRDKLELNFYKTEQGRGGEIEKVTYDKQSRRAVITLLRPGASQNIVGWTEYPFFVNGSCYRLSVSPDVDAHLENLEPYCGVSKKTLLLTGIQEKEEGEDSIQDMIEIHFQKPSNGGGEIENIKYLSKGAACVCFEEDTRNSI